MAKRGQILAVATLALVCAGSVRLPSAAPVQRQPQRDNPIAQSTDIAWLESIAGSADGAATFMREHNVRFGQAKDWRTTAFARLGEIGTPESLAAVRRIEAAAKSIVPAPPRVRFGTAPSPGWHMGDGVLRSVAEVRALDGTTYSVVVANLVGGLGLFLSTTTAPSDPSAWSRPKRIPAPVYRGSRSPSLSWKSAGVLTLSFTQTEPPPRGIMEGTRSPGAPPPALGSQTFDIVVADVLRDSDNDGWTDVEETILGLDPHKADTDGDGIPDGKDVCPNYAPARDDANDEGVQIIQKAVFAAFGLSRSLEPLYPIADSRKVQLWGYQAPIIYGHPPPKWGMTYSPGETPEGLTFVTWKIASQSKDEALVVLSDSEGPLAAGGQEVHLKKMDGEWFVVSRVTTWIS